MLSDFACLRVTEKTMMWKIYYDNFSSIVEIRRPPCFGHGGNRSTPRGTLTRESTVSGEVHRVRK